MSVKQVLYEPVGSVFGGASSATETDETLGELVYRATDPAEMRMREEPDAPPVLEGRMMPYDEWTEVNSAVEGHFLERFAPGSLGKTMRERAHRIRALFEHGLDFLGRQPIATIEEFDERDDGAYYEATLLRGLPDLLVDGLRHGQYGSSIRFRPVPGKWDRNRKPEASDHNPEGIPEHTIREAYVLEFSVVTFPQYEGATAHVRSLTDEVHARQLLGNPERLIEIIRATSEPQHSGREEPEPEPQEDPAAAPPASVPQRSRSTQPTRKYLTPQEAEPTWRIKRNR